MSNPRLFRYEWIWEKDKPSNFSFVKYGPLKYHESILVFGKPKGTYNPQMTLGTPNHSVGKGIRRKENESGPNTSFVKNKIDGVKFPRSVLKFNRESKPLHPTQKPTPLFEYLIKTYTNIGDIVLDNAAGSGTTGAACRNTGRKYILIEKEKAYVQLILKRLEK